MTIEFHCPHCQKLLKTADDKAGVRAKCPGCGDVVTVPGVTTAAPTPESEAAGFDASFGAYGDDDFRPLAPVRAPKAEPQEESGEMRPCPMCGEEIRAAATRCRYCGENLLGGEGPDGTPTKIEAGDILSRSWAIFQKEMGMCIAIVLLAGFLNVLASIPTNAISFLQESGAIDKDLAPVAVTAQVVFWIMGTVFGYYLSIGQSIALLKIARGQSVQIGDLFSGGPYFWRAVGAGLLFGLLYLVGFLCCLVGAVIVLLMFSPYKYALIDRDVGAIESLSVAYRITTNNLLALFVLGLAAIGLTILGFLTCGLGLLIVAPFIMLLEAVAYLAMSGLPTAEQRRPAA